MGWCGGPSSLVSEGYQGLFPLGVKCPGHEADCLLPPSAEFNNSGDISLLHNMSSWHGAKLIKNRTILHFLVLFLLLLFFPDI
jgi:hypothetical protein